MTYIYPIVKKNLIYVKRNFFKSLIQLFYPTFALLLFIYITIKTKADEPKKEETYDHYEETFNFAKLRDKKYDLIRSGKNQDSFAVIGNANDTSILKEFILLKSIIFIFYLLGLCFNNYYFYFLNLDLKFLLNVFLLLF